MSQVINEVHDVNRINISDDAIANALGDTKIDVGGGEMVAAWDASEYGISREQVRAQLAAAETPEARQAVIDDLRERAIRRADLAEIDGKVACVVAGEAPWHQLGVHVDQAMSSTEAIVWGSLDYTCMKIPCHSYINGQAVKLPGIYGVGRLTDSGTIHPFAGVHVGAGYTIFQNDEAFRFLDNIMGESGAKFDAVGATQEGRKTFMSVLFPEVFEAVKGDEVRHYGLLTNAHDGTESMSFFGTDVRTVCSNTRRQALSGRRGGMSIPHTRNMRQLVKAAEASIAESRRQFVDFGEMATVMARATVKASSFADAVVDKLTKNAHFSNLFLTTEQRSDGIDVYLGDIAEELREKRVREFNRRSENVGKFIDAVNVIANSPTNTALGTVWGAFNSVTEYANHGLRYQGSSRKRAETRLGDILGGRADTINTAALQVAEELLAV